MPQHGKASKRHLATVHPDMRLILETAIVTGPDHSVICGHRNEMDQNDAVNRGASKLSWPDSKHNELPSKAADVVPYPIDWNDLDRFRVLQGYLMATADRLYLEGKISHVLRAGGDWDRDYDLDDQRFIDLPHYELVKPQPGLFDRQN